MGASVPSKKAGRPPPESKGKPKKKRKKKGPNQQARDLSTQDIGPRSFVFARRDPPAALKLLVNDWKKVMLPHCALRLKALRRNTVKDFAAAAAAWQASHLQVFYASDSRTSLKLMRFPRGPTVTFRVCSFTTAREVVAQLKPSHRGLAGSQQLYTHPPVLVLNGFKSEDLSVVLTAELLQSLFPPLVVDEVKLASCKRTLLFHRHPNGLIDVRHYAVVTRSAAASTRTVRRLVSGGTRAIPRKIGAMDDVADIVAKADAYSDVDSDAAAAQVEAPEALNKNIAASSTASVGLVELGPRMTLEVFTITDGFWEDGDVLYKSEAAAASTPRPARRGFDASAVLPEREAKIAAANAAELAGEGNDDAEGEGVAAGGDGEAGAGMGDDDDDDDYADGGMDVDDE